MGPSSDLLEVVKNPENMPLTEGFFFGRSDNDQQQIDEDQAQFGRAIAFLTSPHLAKEEGVIRSVVYRASW